MLSQFINHVTGLQLYHSYVVRAHNLFERGMARVKSEELGVLPYLATPEAIRRPCDAITEAFVHQDKQVRYSNTKVGIGLVDMRSAAERYKTEVKAGGVLAFIDEGLVDEALAIARQWGMVDLVEHDERYLIDSREGYVPTRMPALTKERRQGNNCLRPQRLVTSVFPSRRRMGRSSKKGGPEVKRPFMFVHQDKQVRCSKTKVGIGSFRSRFILRPLILCKPGFVLFDNYLSCN